MNPRFATQRLSVARLAVPGPAISSPARRGSSARGPCGLRSAVEAIEARRTLLPWAGGDNTQPIDPAILERMKGWGSIK